ncbi:MAG: hypothetical protein K2K03_00725 [Prevotella sp.]|nr:hypothetical protein [Prevotella sp.]
MPVLIKVTEVTSPKAMACGKHFGHVVTTETMSYQQLCKHMAEHNSVYGEDVCMGVATKLKNCILEQLLEGKKVEFGDLGTFYLAVKTVGTDKEENFNMGTNIKGLYLRFAPSRKDISDLSSKALKKRASFMNAKGLLEVKSKKGTDSSIAES